MAKKTDKKKGSKKGLSVKTYSGLNKKRYEQKGGGGNRVILKPGETVALQFLHEPDSFVEFDMHRFKEGGNWSYVPCLGDDCPLCESFPPASDAPLRNPRRLVAYHAACPHRTLANWRERRR